MATRITATELARNLSDILNRVRYKGETFIVERNGEVVAEVTPSNVPKTITLRQLIDLWPTLPKPDPGYWADVEEAHRLMNQPLPESPAWA